MYTTINSIGILLTLPHKLRWRLNMIIVTGQLATTINFHSARSSGWFLILFMGCKVMTFIYDPFFLSTDYGLDAF